MSIGTICSRTTELADPGQSALSAAKRMQERNVGSLVVVDAHRKPIGIVTDRDLVLRVVAAGRDPARVTVREAMTANPRTVAEDMPIEDALALMRTLGVRRIPVVDGPGGLVGIVSVDDALKHLAQELGNLARVLGASQPGSALPALRTAEPARPPARRKASRAAGLERAAADPEC